MKNKIIALSLVLTVASATQAMAAPISTQTNCNIQKYFTVQSCTNANNACQNYLESLINPNLKFFNFICNIINKDNSFINCGNNTVTKPDTTPVETPVTTPDTTPVETPVTKPDTTPVETPVTKPDTTPVETPVTKPDTTPVETPVTKPDTTPDNTGSNNNTNIENLSYEEQVVSLVNVERAKYGLSELTLDSNVSNVARIKSQDMINNNYFAHQSPTYGGPGEMLTQFGIKWTAYGENIAAGQKTPSEVVTAWMNSEGHRANILNSNFTKIGVGYVTNSQGKAYWTQMFIRN